MRRSLQILLVLLILGGVFGVASAYAEGRVTVGFVPGQGIVRNATDARQFAELLAARLGATIEVRLFGSETELHQWLSRYHAIDYGWFSETFLGRLPAGELLTLAGADTAAGTSLPGRFVARQGGDVSLLQQVRQTLLAFGDRPDEAILLSTLGLARFVAVEKGVLAEERPAPPATETPAGVETTAAAPTDTSAASTDTPAAPMTIPPSPVTPPLGSFITLAADRLDYDGENEVIEAGGTVILRQGETTLAADELLWQERTRDTAARGNIHLTEPDAELHSQSLHANLSTGLGVARDGRVFMRERNFHLAGEEIERLGEASYRVTGGQFTTCDGDVPDWQFTADRVDVTLGRYATARNVWFEIRNQPLLYLPYLIFPVKSERESGFLLPRVGYSSRKGGILSLAWYEVIDRHLDATIYVDYLSKLGLGKGLEYRYITAEDNAGEVFYYHVTGLQEDDEELQGGEEARQERQDTFALKWLHNGSLPGNVRLTADVDYVEDIEYFEDFGEAATEYNRDHTVSTIMLHRNWKDLSLTLLSEYIKNLEEDNDGTLQRLPELRLNLPLRRLGDSPFFLQAENILTNFVRKEGVDGLRLYIHPELSAPFNPGRWLELTPRVALHGRAYHVDDADGGVSGSDYDNESLAAEYALTASSRFYRVFSFPRWGFDKLKHSIEPQVVYSYIPERSQARLPYFDAFDRVGPTNRVEYALVNRLTGRAVDTAGNRSYRELLNLRLSQSYDIGLSRDDELHDREVFSDLRVELQANPAPGSFLVLDAAIPVYGDGRFTRVTASAGYSGRYGNTASFDYSYISDEDGAVPNNYLGVSLGTALLAPVYANFQERYDFREKQSLESLLSLEYRQKCWSLFVALRHRPALDDGPDEKEVMVGFALSGIGRVGSFSGKPSPTVP